MMTKKHYTKIADIFRRKLREDPLGDRRQAFHALAAELCIILKEDNPAFDRDRFMAACGF